MKKKLIYMIIMIIIIFIMNIPIIATTDKTTTLIYFYTPTCSSYQSLSEYFKELQSKNSSLVIKKFDITDAKNKSLFNKYNLEYKVSDIDKEIVPVVFIGDTYFTGVEKIRAFTEDEIQKGIPTLILNNNDLDLSFDVNNFKDLSWFGIFIAGFINGLNPCSLSMLIFLLSILLQKGKNIFKLVTIQAPPEKNLNRRWAYQQMQA